jgi:hypothetical protein
MFRSFLSLLLVFWAVPTVAQPLPDRRPLLGAVLDSAGKPLENAVVSLRRESETTPATFWGASVSSDARGEFRFPLAEVGRYFLSVEVPGFAPISNQWVVWTPTSPPLRLRLERLVTLRLQIARPDGLPAQNLSFWVRLRGQGNAGQTTRRARTDAQGTLSIAELMPSNYAIFAVSSEGFASKRDISLRAGTEQKLELQKGGELKVSVRETTTQRPLGGALLTLVPENAAEAQRLTGNATEVEEDLGILAAGGDRLAQVSRDGDGSVSLSNLPPGRYRARLTLAGYQTAQTQAVLIEAGLATEISWTLAPQTAATMGLALQLRGAGGTAVAAGEYALRLMRIGENGALEPEGDTPFLPGGHPGRRALSNADGLLRLFPLAAGRYRVFVAPRAPDGDLENGPAEATSLDVTVPAEGATATLALKTP